MTGRRADAEPYRLNLLRVAPWHVQSDGLRWRCFDLDDPALQSGVAILSSDETARAQRFRFDIDRGRYIAAHVALRLSLPDVIAVDPEKIAFTVGQNGKPDLAADVAWTFNLSHSGNVGLLAVAPRDHYCQIGVDIETVSAIDDLRSLAGENFTAEECESLASTNSRDALRFFLRCWTRKEACLKALGTGLTIPARNFTTGLTPDVAKVLIDAEGVKRSLQVKTLFESETCIAALSWCHEPRRLVEPARQAVVAFNQTLAGQSPRDMRI